ncbi:MAG: HAD hydrolase-like protein [Clostridia bacterium]|nr:HAD hydrolase-like protein [Clostridia bacterium]
MDKIKKRLYTHVVWDFNGTILDDVQLGIESVNAMLNKRGLPEIPDVETYREIFNFPIIEYYRSLGFDFDREDYYSVLAPEWVANYMAGEPDCPLVPGVVQTIAAVNHLGVTQVLISASYEAQLREQLDHLGLGDTFSEICGLDNIHAGSKRQLAEEWMAGHPGAVPLFVGDTLHDAEVADAVGADCVLFCGGHQSKKRLSRTGKPLIDRIEDLVAYLDP